MKQPIRTIALLAWAGLALPASAGASPAAMPATPIGQPVAAQTSELAALERRASDRSLSLREREQAADRAIELRRRLISEAAADDPRLPGWLTDQGAALLARLGRDGSDSAAIFGIPLASQHRAAQQAAAEAVDVLKRAARAAQARITTAGGPSEERAGSMEHERTVRIPFFMARAEVILAACADGPARVTHARAAHDAVSQLALANPGPEAARRVNFAAALVFRGDPADHQTAHAEFAGALRLEGAPETPVPAISRAEAWCGLVMSASAAGNLEETLSALKAAMKQPPFVTPDGRADPLFAVLLADAVTKALWSAGAASGDRALLDRAVQAQTDLLARDDLPLRSESLRPLVFEKLAILMTDVPAPGPVPPAARLAKAVAMARDPEHAAEALTEFRAVAAMPEAGEYAADALWEAAVLLTRPDRADPASRAEAAAMLTRLAADYPQSVRASDAMSAALAYARSAASEATGAVRERAEATYQRALELATTSYPALPEIDAWRYERARLIVERRQPGGRDAAEARLAIQLLASIQPGSSVAADIQKLRERAHIGLLEALRAQLESVRAGDMAAARAFARSDLVPAAREAVAWATSRKSPLLPRFRLELADALLDAGQPGSAPIYQDLLAVASDLPGGRPRIGLGLGRALMQAGNPAAAFGHLREVAAALDAPPAEGAEPARPPEFWHAWALMLEILAEENKDGSRSGAIRAHVKRLGSIDSALGGPPWTERIAAVRDRTGP